MDRNKLSEIIAALNRKNVSQPCPRCAFKTFSVVGESEISVVRPPLPQAIGAITGIVSHPSTPIKTTMPTILVSCDNCGYISQHAQVTLGLLSSPPRQAIRGIGDPL